MSSRPSRARSREGTCTVAVEGQTGRFLAPLNKLLHGKVLKVFTWDCANEPPEEAVEGSLLKPALPQNPFPEGPLGPAIKANQTGAL